jgi:thioredoxin reductase (NADPH)
MHDVVIIGGGPAGVSAALWCDELGLDTLLLERDDAVGGQLHSVHNPIHNYLGCHFQNGHELVEKLSAQTSDSDFDLWTCVQINEVDLKTKRVSLASGEDVQGISIIIATGVSRRQLHIPGENEFIGKGIIESGTRDVGMFAGKDVCVIGGGDAAVENALLLADKCATVTLVHRGKQLRARPEFVQRLHGNHCITVFTESRVTAILGKDQVEAVEIHRKEGLKPFQMAVHGVLIRIGVEPNTELFANQLKLDEQGYVVVNAEHETDIPNVFAIGDVSNPRAPTISGAAGAGATAAKVIASRLTAK